MTNLLDPLSAFPNDGAGQLEQELSKALVSAIQRYYGMLKQLIWSIWVKLNKYLPTTETTKTKLFFKGSILGVN